MRVLPIVAREMRENARRQSTYRLRLRVAGQAVLVGIGAYFYSLNHRPPIKLGTALFWGVSGISMLFCLLAGRRSTADCISLEKREGTLGLLFLTDLKGYDVVLGKLAATSVTSLYALLGIFPVLAVPLLTGGMTSGECERMVIVLTNTFFLSVAIGIFASAITREFRAAMAANFFLWLGLVAAPVCAGVGLGMARSAPPWPVFFYSCPIFSFIASVDAIYASSLGPGFFWRSAATDFWMSIAFTHALAWLLVLAACWIVPRTWGDKPARAPSRRWRWGDFSAWVRYGNRDGREAFRKEALDRNAYFWHAARARFKPAHVWTFIVLMGAWWIVCWAQNGHVWLDEATYLGTAALLNTTLKLWITLEAALRLGEDRRGGAFELLLSTPLTVADILRGQLLALRRQFLKPLAVVVAVQIFFLLILHPGHRNYAADIILELIVLPCDVAALIAVVMAASVRGKSQTQATVLAVVRILILPWFLFGVVQWVEAALYWLALIQWEPNPHTMWAQWLGIALAVDVIYGVPAWVSLRRDFRSLATESPRAKTWRARLGQFAGWLRAAARRLVPERLKMPVFAGLGVAVVVGIVQFARPRHAEVPAPVIVAMAQSNAPVRIFPRGRLGIFIVLPDGSLWRWGGNENGDPLRAAVPAQVDDGHDWVKATGNGTHNLGLRADGTIWEWGVCQGTNVATPQPAVRGSNWVDIGAAPPWGGSFALKKDGTLWTWGNYQLSTGSRRTSDLSQIGTASNWTAVACANVSGIGLRSDGTLWVWGIVVGPRNGSMTQTNITEPILLCAQTNWISIDANGQARDREGELWDAANRMPNSFGSTRDVCRLISPNWAANRIESAPYWMNCLIAPNGTLWSTAVHPTEWFDPAPQATVKSMRRVDGRSDWVALWGIRGTAFGLTADGTIWAWGYDRGSEPVVNASSRIRLVQDAVTGRAAGNAGRIGSEPRVLEEPRPLLKMTKGQ
jgi:hypothetical protein